MKVISIIIFFSRRILVALDQFILGMVLLNPHRSKTSIQNVRQHRVIKSSSMCLIH